MQDAIIVGLVVVLNVLIMMMMNDDAIVSCRYNSCFKVLCCLTVAPRKLLGVLVFA